MDTLNVETNKTVDYKYTYQNVEYTTPKICLMCDDAGPSCVINFNYTNEDNDKCVVATDESDPYAKLSRGGYDDMPSIVRIVAEQSSKLTQLFNDRLQKVLNKQEFVTSKILENKKGLSIPMSRLCGASSRRLSQLIKTDKGIEQLKHELRRLETSNDQGTVVVVPFFSPPPTPPPPPSSYQEVDVDLENTEEKSISLYLNTSYILNFTSSTINTGDQIVLLENYKSCSSL